MSGEVIESVLVGLAAVAIAGWVVVLLMMIVR